jgi:osmotically-inducible protein OsmY
MNQTISDLRTQVQTAFLQDDFLQDFGIEILDSNGVITLRGVVPTIEARERAEALARTVDGVTSVINEIDVV